MRILFVYPEYPETFWSFKHVLKFISKKAAFPPLGILTISSMLPPETEKKLIDLNIEELSKDDVMWADYVFISAMIVQKDSVMKISRFAKSLGKKVVAGGPLFSVENIDDFRRIDNFVLDEGEVTFPMFISDLSKGRPLQKVYTSTLKPDLRSTPLPDWNLIKIKKYATMLIQFSRGCPFDCDFCDITRLNGRKPRTKGADQIVSELDSLYNAGWRGPVFMVDDNFIGNRSMVKEALKHILTWSRAKGFPFSFLTEASLDIADDQELMDLMVMTNFRTVFLGIETPNNDSLQECNKFQNSSRDMAISVRKIQGSGLQVQGGFILGFDSDPNDIFEKQIKFIQKIGVATAMVGLLNAVPGTKLYKRLKKEGRILNDSSGNNTDSSVNFMPKMDKERLIEGYKDVIRTLYSSKNYYDRIMTFVAHYTPKMPNSRFSLRDLKALFMSMWILGVIDNGRKYYWKAFTMTLAKNPRAFSTVMTLMIYGFHSRKMAQVL
ncbi:MAG: B12-binding domain-containing radical SAM protein [Candidatus Woesearchaeota archaeon]